MKSKYHKAPEHEGLKRGGMNALNAVLVEVDNHLYNIRAALKCGYHEPLAAGAYMQSAAEEIDRTEDLKVAIGDAFLTALQTEDTQTWARQIERWKARLTSLVNAHQELERALHNNTEPGGLAHDDAIETHTETSPYKTVAHTEARTFAHNVSLEELAEPAKERRVHATVTPPPKSAPADLSTVDMNKLFSNVEGFEDHTLGRFVITADNVRWLQRHLREVGTPPERITTANQARTVLGLTHKLCAPDALTHISELPKTWHWNVTNYITAYVRHVQSALESMSDPPSDLLHDLDECLYRLISFSKTTQPGYIEGLKRDSTPDVGETWYATMTARRNVVDDLLREQNPEPGDADQSSKLTDVLRRLNETTEDPDAHDDNILQLVREARLYNVAPTHLRLINALRDHIDLLRKHDDLREIAQAVEQTVAEEAHAAEQRERDEQSHRVPTTLRSRTHGKSIALLGGNRNAEAEERIASAFEFRSVEWIPTRSGRLGSMDAFRKRLQNGHYDYAIAIENLVGHAWSGLIFKESPDTTIPMMSSGYGIGGLCEAIQRFDGK